MKHRVGHWIITVAIIGWHCMFPYAEGKPVTEIEFQFVLRSDSERLLKLLT
jgi:hypothetical protein